MNGNYPQQPGYPPQPGYAGQQPPRQGMGCCAKGCIVLVIVAVLLGLAVGGGAWYIYHNIAAFISDKPIAIRTYPATDKQYQDVLGRYNAFITALNAGEASKLTLSADDLNILIAKDPEFKDIRGKVYVSIVDNQLVTEACFSDDKTSGPSKKYFGGKLTLTGSFANNALNFVVKNVETMDGKPAPGLVQYFLKNSDFGKGLVQNFNNDLTERRRKSKGLDEALKKLSTVVIQDNKIVATSIDGAPSTVPLATPTPTSTTDDPAVPPATDTPPPAPTPE